MMMHPKDRTTHRQYMEVLRKMSPAERLLKAFELSEFAKQLFIHGLKRRFPDATEDEFQRILRARLEQCHNRKY